MARTRAILTATGREQIAGVGQVDDAKRHQAVSRVRARIRDELPADVRVLREHNPKLYQELRSVVCENG